MPTHGSWPWRRWGLGKLGTPYRGSFLTSPPPLTLSGTPGVGVLGINGKNGAALDGAASLFLSSPYGRFRAADW